MRATRSAVIMACSFLQIGASACCLGPEQPGERPAGRGGVRAGRSRRIPVPPHNMAPEGADPIFVHEPDHLLEFTSRQPDYLLAAVNSMRAWRRGHASSRGILF